MQNRFMSISLPYLHTDWFTLREASLRNQPLALYATDRGRMVITAVNAPAQRLGIITGMVVADAKALCPAIQIRSHDPALSNRLLHSFAVWCIRFTPVAAPDPPDGILLDITGCAHLWGGELEYLNRIKKKFNESGYTTQIAIADTIGAAWAIARFGNGESIVGSGKQVISLDPLAPEALRINSDISDRLKKLGLSTIQMFRTMPGQALKRRFGPELSRRYDEAIGTMYEGIQPVLPPAPYHERLNCMDPIVSLSGIKIALERLLNLLCCRLLQEGKGLMEFKLLCYRVDHHLQQIQIGTNNPSQNAIHLFKLFEDKLQTIEPGLGIELFVLEGSAVGDIIAYQEKLWANQSGTDHRIVEELLDTISGKIGTHNIQRYMPDEHYWPERAVKPAKSLSQHPALDWRIDRPRPLYLLPIAQSILVTALVPDYPPMLFRYKGNLHRIIKADGPERIEQEWWIQSGEHRDYYIVENQTGARFWIFRSGHYDPDKNNQWFLHGFFA